MGGLASRQTENFLSERVAKYLRREGICERGAIVIRFFASVVIGLIAGAMGGLVGVGGGVFMVPVDVGVAESASARGSWDKPCRYRLHRDNWCYRLWTSKIC